MDIIWILIQINYKMTSLRKSGRFEYGFRLNDINVLLLIWLDVIMAL